MLGALRMTVAMTTLAMIAIACQPPGVEGEAPGFRARSKVTSGKGDSDNDSDDKPSKAKTKPKETTPTDSNARDRVPSGGSNTSDAGTETPGPAIPDPTPAPTPTPTPPPAPQQPNCGGKGAEGCFFCCLDANPGATTIEIIYDDCLDQCFDSGCAAACQQDHLSRCAANGSCENHHACLVANGCAQAAGCQ